MASPRLIKKGDASLVIQSTLTRFANGSVKVGVLRGGDAHDERLTVGEVAVIHEFGAPAANIPPRSFVWLGVQRVKKQVREMMPRLVVQIRKGDITEVLALRRVGDLLQKGMRSTFKEWRGAWAPLAPRTIAKKGHDHPLIDTRKLYDYIESEVTTPGGKK